MAEKAVMEIASVEEAIAWQAEHATRASAPCTGRVIQAGLAILKTDTLIARRMANWPGLSLEDAMPLRIAGGLHNLFLTGDAPQLGQVYAGTLTDQAQIDEIVAGLAQTFDARLAPWLDGPPQTNEAGRSASIMAGLLWLSRRLGPRFELNEIGASAGVNTMMERYAYDLGGVKTGPADSPMQITPEWRGPPPPSAKVEIVAIRGCDIAPVDIADPAQALRLKSYVWADATQRMARIDAAIALAAEKRPDLAAMDAGEFVARMLARPQAPGVTRVLDHSVMWQYLPRETRDQIRSAMEDAGAKATPEQPLAWVKVETNRQTFRHELQVRYWPHAPDRGDAGRPDGGLDGGEDEWALLGQAHPHGAWIEWHGDA